MTAIITTLDQGKKTIDNYLLDQRPLNLEEMRNLNGCIVSTINDVQAIFRMIPQDSPIRKHPLMFHLAQQCGIRFIPQP